MLLKFTPQRWEDYTWWLAQDRKIAKRINLLHGCWSRRIDGEHRIVYSVDKTGVTVHQCRYHY